MSGLVLSGAAGPAPGAWRSRGAVALVGLALLVSAPVFWGGYAELAQHWTTPQYSHGPVVLVMAGWLGLRSLRDARPLASWREDGSLLPAAALVAAGLAAGALGTLAGIGDIAAYGLIPWILGLLTLALGPVRARPLRGPVALLVLMLPLPQFLYWKVTILLQALSSALAARIIEAIGLTVRREGNIIDLGSYQLQVAEACAGLQYLIPVLCFAILFATILRGRLWQRLALVLSAAPLAVGMNAARVAVTAVLVDRFGPAAADGFLHAVEGWVVLLLSLLLLVGLAATLRGRGDGPLFDLDVSGFGPVLAGEGARPRHRALALAVLAGALISSAVLAAPARAASGVERLTFARFPERIEDLHGLRRALPAETAAVLGADDYLDMTYYAPGALPVHVFAAFYGDQSAGGGLHSPEICLPVNGWEIVELGQRRLELSDTGYGSFEAVRAVISNGLETQLVYYWFEQRGTRMTNGFRAKIDVLVDGLLRGRRDGAILRFVTPVTDPHNISPAEERLRGVMRKSLRVMPQFIPY